MRLSRSVGQLLGVSFAFTLLASLFASACGSSSGSSVAGAGASDGNGASSGGSSSLGLPTLGLAGVDPGSGDGTAKGGASCAGQLTEAKRLPLDMYVMLDASGSMLDPTDGNANITKWQAVSSALSDFVNDPASSGIGMGLQVFPLTDPKAPAACTTNAQCGDFGPCFLKTCWGYPDGLVPCTTDAYCGQYGPCLTFGICANDDSYVCPTIGANCQTPLGKCIAPPPSVCLATADCRPARYAAPAAEVAQLPGAKAALLAAISAAMPEGQTPSGPALQGAIQQAGAYAAAHPEHQVVAVFATDGLPTLCEPLTIADVAGVAAAGKAATPSISTFVIGVFGAADLDAPANLNTIAKSGGTTKAFIVDTKGDVASQFRAALDTIRSSHLSCDLAVPVAEAGKTVDYNQVNVAYDNGSGAGAQSLFYVETAAGCAAATTGGWYYDTKPSDGTPQRIIVCPTTCADFGQTDMGSVNIELGCTTRRIVK
jgi:hypothetical protein